MRILLFLPLLFSFFSHIHAQSIVLCESYDTKGNPSGIGSSWVVKPGGASVYMLYRQPTAIQSGTWYIYVDYDWDETGELSAYNTVEIEPEAGKNWFVYDSKFEDAGKYKAMVMHDGIEVASTNFQISIESGNVTTAEDSDDEIDTYYYENSSVGFCNSVDASGTPEGLSETFSLDGKESISVTIYVENGGQPFKTKQVLVNIYKDEETAPYGKYSLDIQSEWDFMSFKQAFTQPGTYIVDIYNDDIYINTGTVTITQ